MKKVLAALFGLISIYSGFTIILGILFKIMHWPGANQMLVAGFGMTAIQYVVFSVFILYDIIKSKFENKFLWTLGFIFCPMIVGILYLVFKNKIIKDPLGK